MTKVLPLLLAPVALALAVQARSSPPATDAPLSAVALGRIDAHAHFFAEAKPVLDLFDRLNVTAVELRDAEGRYLLPDDAAFEPVFAGLARRGTTLYAHLAEPIAAWEPLDPKSPDYDYYKNAPAWHVHGRPGMPSKREILEARDRLLAKHPTLKVVGCHLGSMEEDVDAIAQRLDRYPNFVVDTAARVTHLTLQPREKVRAFLVKYQDRVLYGTDMGLMPGQDPEATARRLEAEYGRDWTYFATRQTIEVDGRKVEGLALPEPVLRRIFRENALRWVPGLATATHGRP
jgi:predicted TIM-barrel fold metal-dependent hydrolase